MAKQRGNTFSFLKGASKPDKFGVLPIKAEFEVVYLLLSIELTVHLHGQDGEEDLNWLLLRIIRILLIFLLHIRYPYPKEHLQLLVINLLYPEYLKGFLLRIKN